jgi:hypothetical protein
MMFADAALEMSLDWAQDLAWRRTIHQRRFGFVGDLRGANDVGSYRFGILHHDAGYRSVVGGRAQLVRAHGLSHYIYRISTQHVLLKTTEDPAVLPVGASRSFWRRNPALLIGVSLFRPR